MYPIPANATRIQYLESTGTQYVDTGVALSDSSEVRLRIYAVETSGRYGVFGSRSGASSNNVSGYINYGAFGLDFNNGSYSTYRKEASITAGDTAVASASATKREISISGGTPATDTDVWSGSFTTPSNCLICSINGSGWTLARIRIFSFQIYEAGVLVRDFVPVRVGQVGYLFDRVSGTLFGNAGTGDFVLGPDTFSQGVLPTRMMVGGVRKKAQKIQKLRVYSDGEFGHVYDIRTDYPLSAGADVTGTVDGNPRSGTLDYNLYTVMGPGGYVGEFADVTPGGVSARWFDSGVGDILTGYCEIIEE